MIDDLASLMSMPVITLKRIFNNFMCCICHCALEQFLKKNNKSIIDIGIGNLNILITEDEIQYKFIPSSKFESMLVDTIKSKQSPLVDRAEEILTSKVNMTYKELL